MKVILLTDIAKVGRKYDVKDVSSGYAQNYLFPRRLAEIADKSKEAASERLLKEELLLKDLEKLSKVKVTMAGKANEQGHLFQGIHKDEIAEALQKESNIEIHGDMIELEQPIKAVGEHTITIKAKDNTGSFTLDVVRETEK
jgi:large subunit ribosomal protein L9